MNGWTDGRPNGWMDGWMNFGHCLLLFELYIIYNVYGLLFTYTPGYICTRIPVICKYFRLFMMQ